MIIRKLFLIIFLLLGISEGFSQPSMKFTSDNGKVVKGQLKKGKPIHYGEYKTRQQIFDELNLMRSDGSFSEIRTALDKHFVKKGEAARIKFVFNPRRVSRIDVEGVEQAFTPRDKIKGKYIAVVKPEKTKVIRVKITTCREDGSEGITMPDNRIIVVLDEKEFEELDAEFKRCEENKDLEGLAKINLTINDYIKKAGIDIGAAKRGSL